MSAGTFASADPAVVNKYMPNGTAPASMSSFVLFAGEDTVLIDTGAGGETWFKKLTDLGIKPESVKLILLTHFHGDHIGGLFQGNARRFLNAKVLASTPEYDSKGAPFEKIKAVYGDDFAKFNFGDEVFANSLIRVTAMDASGHTPGHSAFLLESKLLEKDKLLIIGDLLHAAALQFPAPEACASYDGDPKKSIAARKSLLDFAAQKKILIGGMHLPPPSVGSVTKEDQGYSFDLKQ
jgi:glyoxylase-like metal-dependent hydrolase (beta-lactamase superfamily II)